MAISNASSNITQIGDRWHILHQLFDAVKKEVFSVVPESWVIVTEKEESPVTRKAERFRVENEEKRWMRIQKVHSLQSEGYSISAIAKQLHLSRGTIYADLEQSQKPSHKRSSSFDRFHPFIRILLQQNQTGDQIEKA
ncbi:hypothetical protein J2S21_004391 [Peribacillus cavernae]|nr:hypothetical protein [Peribacillus cavernae]